MLGLHTRKKGVEHCVLGYSTNAIQNLFKSVAFHPCDREQVWRPTGLPDSEAKSAPVNYPAETKPCHYAVFKYNSVPWKF